MKMRQLALMALQVVLALLAEWVVLWPLQVLALWPLAVQTASQTVLRPPLIVRLRLVQARRQLLAYLMLLLVQRPVGLTALPSVQALRPQV